MLFVHFGDGGLRYALDSITPTTTDFFTWLLALVAVLLAAIAVALVMGGIYGFIHFDITAKRIAEEVARKTASEVAEKVAQEATSKYIKNIEEILAGSGIVRKGPTDAQADKIAEEEAK